MSEAIRYAPSGLLARWVASIYGVASGPLQAGGGVGVGFPGGVGGGGGHIPQHGPCQRAGMSSRGGGFSSFASLCRLSGPVLGPGVLADACRILCRGGRG